MATCSLCRRVSIVGLAVSTAPRTIRATSSCSLRSRIFPCVNRDCIEQVVNQPRQVLDLAVDHVQARGDLIPAALHGELDRALDRGHRIAQLVGQHRQELVLASIGRGELVDSPAKLILAGFDPPPRSVQGLHQERDHNPPAEEESDRNHSRERHVPLVEGAQDSDDGNQNRRKKPRSQPAVPRTDQNSQEEQTAQLLADLGNHQT